MSQLTWNAAETFDEFVDGDDSYNSIFAELDLPATDASPPSFNCLGEVNVKEIQVNQSGYLNSKIGPDFVLIKHSCDRGKSGSINLFGKTWDKGTCLINYLDELFKLASMELMILDEASVIHCGTVTPDSSDVTKGNYYQIRRNCIELCLFVNDFLLRLLSYPDYHWGLQDLVDKVTKKLISLRKQLGKITELPEYIYQFSAHSQGNKCEEAGYHVVHCRFDFCWLDLHLTATLRQAATRSIETPLIELQYMPFFRELFHLALARFSKIDPRDILKKSPFSCTCVQEMWLMLQILTDSYSKNNTEKEFWTYFECLILSFLKLRSSSLTEVEDSPMKLNSSKLSSSSSHLFSLWLLYNVGKLYTFNDRRMLSNYPLLENILKNFLSQEISELELRTCLQFVEKICLELWEPRTETLLILWEYFQKRLNQLFYVPGQDLDSVATVGKSALCFVSQVKGRLEDPYLVKNSYEHFLRIVGLHLRRCSDNQNQRHWNLMTGRIYSKLTPPKLLSLNQTGEHHFVSLFLTLAVSADLHQVMSKFSNLCAAYAGSKGRLGTELIKGQLALCLLSVERGESIVCLVHPLTQSLATADVSKNKELFSITIDAFSDILDHHHSLFLGQHLFIDSWISRYLSVSSSSDSVKLLDVLLSLVVKVKRHIDVDPSKEMEDLVERLWSQLGSYLMSSTNNISVIIADIAANLASIYLALSNSARFSNIIAVFSNNQSSDVRLVQRFITQLLENNKIKDALSNLDQLVIETWIKSNLVLYESDLNEMKTLVNVIATLPEIREICGTSAVELLNSDEPLLEFFSAVHLKYQSATTDSERLFLMTKVSSYFKDMEKWLKPILLACQSAQQISKIYFVIGSAFKIIFPLLYIKSKPNSLIQSSINLMLLPVTVHNEEFKIHPFILAAVRKTLHLFIQGLNTLGPASDPYIARCVKELIAVYIPRCLINTGPLPSQHHSSSFSLIALFNQFEPSVAGLILNNLALVFFRPKSRTPLPNAIHALRYIKEILLLHSASENVILAVLSHSVESICDIVMYCDNKTSVYIMSKDVLKLFFENNIIKRSNILSVEVEDLLSRLCTSNLAWSSRQLFDLLYLLCSYVPDILKKFLPKLLQHIKLIETKRGVTYDKILRLGYERIATRLS